MGALHRNVQARAQILVTFASQPAADHLGLIDRKPAQAVFQALPPLRVDQGRLGPARPFVRPLVRVVHRLEPPAAAAVDQVVIGDAKQPAAEVAAAKSLRQVFPDAAPDGLVHIIEVVARHAAREKRQQQSGVLPIQGVERLLGSGRASGRGARTGSTGCRGSSSSEAGAGVAVVIRTVSSLVTNPSRDDPVVEFGSTTGSKPETVI